MGRGSASTSSVRKACRRATVPEWPDVRYDEVPVLEEAEQLALEVRGLVTEDPNGDPLSDFAELLRLGQFRLDITDLAVDRGGLEAMMVPRRQGGFQIHVDPRPPSGWGATCSALRQEISRHRLRFRAAHEIAHSFFYEPHGAIFRRLRPASAAEEEFCDAFARALLVPLKAARQATPGARGVCALQRKYDVSIELAARAFAAAHPAMDVLIGYRVRGIFSLQWASAGNAGDKLLSWTTEKSLGADDVVTLGPPRDQIIYTAGPARPTERPLSARAAQRQAACI